MLISTLQGSERPDDEGKPAADVADSSGFAAVRVAADAVPEESRPDAVSVWLANNVSLEILLGIDEIELERLLRVLSSC